MPIFINEKYRVLGNAPYGGGRTVIIDSHIPSTVWTPERYVVVIVTHDGRMEGEPWEIQPRYLTPLDK
jgi:hypothetical protein